MKMNREFNVEVVYGSIILFFGLLSGGIFYHYFLSDNILSCESLKEEEKVKEEEVYTTFVYDDWLFSVYDDANDRIEKIRKQPSRYYKILIKVNDYVGDELINDSVLCFNSYKTGKKNHDLEVDSLMLIDTLSGGEESVFPIKPYLDYEDCFDVGNNLNKYSLFELILAYDYNIDLENDYLDFGLMEEVEK